MSDDWEKETKNVRKLRAKPRHVTKPRPLNKRTAPIGEPRLSYQPSTHLPLLQCGEFSGVDAGKAKKLKRGELPIEATLDLHGMTQEEAFAALTKTLACAQTRGLRVALIVTGKGRDGAGGVLKKALPGWLNLPEIRPHILAFAYAQQAQGGTGAFTLLLKKKSLG